MPEISISTEEHNTHEPSPLTTRLIRKDREKKKEFEKRAQKKSPPKIRKMVVL